MREANDLRPELVSLPPPSKDKPISFPRALVREMRPRQWTKNAAVLAPLLFARAVFHGDSALRALIAAVAFCLAASGIYVLNDWLDREQDRQHPEKRLRPIAAGLISGYAGAVLLVFLWASASALAVWLGLTFSLVLSGYVVLQLVYSLFVKHQVILDVLFIASGFILRVVAGAVAISVPVSNWLYLCTFLLALFLGFAKRRNELWSLQSDAAAHRANLSEYSLPMLDQFISVCAAACILAYGLYTVSPETVHHVGSDNLKFTLPFVMYGFFRYLFLIHRRNVGGSPERVLLSDLPLLLDLLLFVGVAATILYLNAPK